MALFEHEVMNDNETRYLKHDFLITMIEICRISPACLNPTILGNSWTPNVFDRVLLPLLIQFIFPPFSTFLCPLSIFLERTNPLKTPHASVQKLSLGHVLIRFSVLKVLVLLRKLSTMSRLDGCEIWSIWLSSWMSVHYPWIWVSIWLCLVLKSRAWSLIPSLGGAVWNPVQASHLLEQSWSLMPLMQSFGKD